MATEGDVEKVWQDITALIQRYYGLKPPSWCDSLSTNCDKLPDGSPKFWIPIREATGLEVLERFIDVYRKYRIDLNTKNSDGKSLIHYLLMKRTLTVDVLKVLVDFGVDPLVPDDEGQTILFQAFDSKAKTELIEFIIDNIPNLDYNGKNNDGMTLLQKAIYTEQPITVVKKILDKGANIFALGYSGGTFLHWICYKNLVKDAFYYDQVFQLAGSLRNKVDSDGQIPLTLLLESCDDILDPDVFNILIPSKDLPQMSSASQPNVFFSMLSGTKNYLDLLPNLIDAGFTLTSDAIHMIIVEHRSTDWIPLLIGLGAPVEVEHVIAARASAKYRQVLPVMLKALDENLVDEHPDFACQLLQLSSNREENTYESLKLLFDKHKIDVNYSQHFRSVLYYLVKKNCYKLADRLLQEYPQLDVNAKCWLRVGDYDADVLVLDETLGTALELALDSFYYDMAIVLIKNFAKIPTHIGRLEIIDPSCLLHLCLLLSFIGCKKPLIEEKINFLKPHLKEPAKLEKLRSLVELSCYAFQSYVHSYDINRQDVINLVNSYPKPIQRYLKLDHISVQDLEFKYEYLNVIHDPYDGFDDDDDDDYDDYEDEDDEDNFFGSDNDSWGLAGEGYDSDVSGNQIQFLNFDHPYYHDDDDDDDDIGDWGDEE